MSGGGAADDRHSGFGKRVRVRDARGPNGDGAWCRRRGQQARVRDRTTRARVVHGGVVRSVGGELLLRADLQGHS